MIVSNIKLVNFKNYESESFEFSPKYNAVVGNNGMGKTNLLDAIYFSCMTKSNFIKLDKSLVLKNANFLRTEALISKDSQWYKVVCKFDTKKKKIFELNGKTYEKLSEHVGKFPVVFIVPGDQTLITEGSKERRALIDNTLSQLDSRYLMSLYQYNALLNQRNAYLKSVLKSGNFSRTLAETYTDKMIVLAEYVYHKRQEFITKFSKVFAEKYKSISDNRELASCTYKTQLIKDSFKNLSLQNLDRDRYTGRTSIGIHKDDIVFLMNGDQVKHFASQGQTKSFILSIKLTQFDIISEDLGIKPILLLDDLFDKLDHGRVQNLIHLLEKEDVEQVFISDTDENRIVQILRQMNVSFKKFVINGGKQLNRDYASEEE